MAPDIGRVSAESNRSAFLSVNSSQACENTPLRRQQVRTTQLAERCTAGNGQSRCAGRCTETLFRPQEPEHVVALPGLGPLVRPNGNRRTQSRSRSVVLSAGSTWKSVSSSSSVWAKHLCTAGWPIQAKDVKTLSPHLLSLVEAETHLDAFRFLYDPSYIQLREGYICRNSSLLQKDVDLLLAAHLIEKIDYSVNTDSVMFRTVEIGKRRFRIVHDCKAANDAVDSPPQVAFDSIAYIRSLAGSYSCAACFDMTSYFHQFALAPECRNQFAFRVDESWFRPTRAPMGFKKIR